MSTRPTPAVAILLWIAACASEESVMAVNAPETNVEGTTNNADASVGAPVESATLAAEAIEAGVLRSRYPMPVGATPPTQSRHAPVSLVAKLTGNPTFHEAAGNAQFRGLTAEDGAEYGHLEMDVTLPLKDLPNAHFRTRSRYEVTSGAPTAEARQRILDRLTEVARLVRRAAEVGSAKAFLSVYPEAVAEVTTNRNGSRVRLESKVEKKTSALGVELVDGEQPQLYGVVEHAGGRLLTLDTKDAELSAALGVMHTSLVETNQKHVECVVSKSGDGSFKARCK